MRSEEIKATALHVQHQLRKYILSQSLSYASCNSFKISSTFGIGLPDVAVLSNESVRRRPLVVVGRESCSASSRLGSFLPTSESSDILGDEFFALGIEYAISLVDFPTNRLPTTVFIQRVESRESVVTDRRAGWKVGRGWSGFPGNMPVSDVFTVEFNSKDGALRSRAMSNEGFRDAGVRLGSTEVIEDNSPDPH